jgi:hypothetical protein
MADKETDKKDAIKQACRDSLVSMTSEVATRQSKRLSHSKPSDYSE